MPRVRLRWTDGRATVHEPDYLPVALVVPGADDTGHSFRLVGNPDPPDPDGLRVYKEKLGRYYDWTTTADELAFVRGIGSYSPRGQRISVAKLLLRYAYSLKHREHWGQLDVEKLTAEVEALVREL